MINQFVDHDNGDDPAFDDFTDANLFDAGEGVEREVDEQHEQQPQQPQQPAQPAQPQQQFTHPTQYHVQQYQQQHFTHQQYQPQYHLQQFQQQQYLYQQPHPQQQQYLYQQPQQQQDPIGQTHEPPLTYHVLEPPQQQQQPHEQVASEAQQQHEHVGSEAQQQQQPHEQVSGEAQQQQQQHEQVASEAQQQHEHVGSEAQQHMSSQPLQEITNTQMDRRGPGRPRKKTIRQQDSQMDIENRLVDEIPSNQQQRVTRTRQKTLFTKRNIIFFKLYFSYYFEPRFLQKKTVNSTQLINFTQFFTFLFVKKKFYSGLISHFKRFMC